MVRFCASIVCLLADDSPVGRVVRAARRSKLPSISLVENQSIMKANHTIRISLELTAFAIFFATLSPVMLKAAYVDGIELVSESYHITAEWTETYSLGGEPTNYSGGYDLSTLDGSPVSAATAGHFNGVNANANIDKFSLYDESSAGPATGIYYGTIQTQAQGVWEFRPANNLLNVGLSINAYYSYYGLQFGGLTVTLIDTTDSSTLLNLVNPLSYAGASGDGYYGETNYLFAVDPGRVYAFSISGYSDSYDYDNTSLDITASMTSVPEPSCLLIAGAFLAIAPKLSRAWLYLGRKETE